MLKDNKNINSSNLNSIVEYYLKQKKKETTILELEHFYEPVEGYIYSIFNEMYKFYGDNVKKCGNSENPQKRALQYITGYVEPCKIIKISDKFIDKCFAETLLFFYLKEHRLKNNREFFDCNDEIIENAFSKVDNFFKLYNTKQKIIEHLVIDNNYNKYYNKCINDVKKNREKKKDVIDINKIINLDYKNFMTSYEELNNNKLMGYQQIKNLFWLEKELKINRFEVNDIDKNIDVTNFKNIILTNKSIIEIILINKYNRGSKYFNNQINKKVNKMNTHNKIQKFYVDCIDNICKNMFKKTILKTNNGFDRLYNFIKI